MNANSLFSFSLCIVFILNIELTNQAYYTISYISKGSGSHKVKLAYDTNDTANPEANSLLSIKTEDMVEIIADAAYNNKDPRNRRYKRFLPNHDFTHPLGYHFVVYDIQRTCSGSRKIIEFDVKYFRNLAPATAFYTAASGTTTKTQFDGVSATNINDTGCQAVIGGVCPS